MTEGGRRTSRRFSAFISYSSADADFARRLHRRLETYRLPRRLASSLPAGTANRLKPLFRDLDELGAAHDLSAAVRDALAQSDFLIVVCSPNAARSAWVGREIEYFRELHGDGGILAALAEGDPATAFPPALRHATGGHEIEPLAADFRRDSGFRRLAMLKLVAALAGVNLDQLVQRDAQRTTQQVAGAAAGAVSGLALVAGLGWMALDARAEAERRRTQATTLVDYMLDDVRKDLQRAGRLDNLAQLNERALSSVAGPDAKGKSDGEQRQQAKILQAMCEDDEKAGDLPKARARCTEAYRLTAGLVAARPDAENVFAHAQSEYWIGFLDWRSGNGPGARRGFEAYAALARRLMTLEPNTTRGLSELGYAETNLGMLALRQRGDMASAHRHFTASLGVKRALAAKAPDNVEAKRDIANVHAWLADTRRLQGRFAEARANRAAQRGILQALADADPQNVELQSDLLGNALAVARIEAAEGDYQAAVTHLDEGGFRAAQLVRKAPDNRSFKRQARAFDLFRVKFLLDDSRRPIRTGELASDLGDCSEARNAGDRELTAFCRILLDRVTAVTRSSPTDPGVSGHDVYTARWGLNLAEEAGRRRRAS